jgi:hypothetical protein
MNGSIRLRAANFQPLAEAVILGQSGRRAGPSPAVPTPALAVVNIRCIIELTQTNFGFIGSRWMCETLAIFLREETRLLDGCLACVGHKLDREP